MTRAPSRDSRKIASGSLCIYLHLKRSCRKWPPFESLLTLKVSGLWIKVVFWLPRQALPQQLQIGSELSDFDALFHDKEVRSSDILGGLIVICGMIKQAKAETSDDDPDSLHSAAF
jgi:hypothetical protein